jgi:hypothetical protein
MSQFNLRLKKMLQFRLKTLVIAMAASASIAAISRWDATSAIVGLGGLFTIFVFAEDIWPWLPGAVRHPKTGNSCGR